MEKIKLKNCPFCGEKAELRKTKGLNLKVYAAHVSCSYCGAATRLYSTITGAIAAWNSRADITESITKEIQIKYFTDKINKLSYVDGKSDWIDLQSSEDIKLKKGDFKLIPLGVAIKLPTGYEAIIVPRSSTFKNYGIIQTNSIGIIDNSYCGDNDQWMLPVYATRDIVIHMNDRICQFRIVKNQPKIEFGEVDVLEEENRGGFGSTGV